MRGTTADHRAKGDNAVVALAGGQTLRHQRQLKGSGCPDQMNIGIGHAMAAQGVGGAADQALHDEAVEAGRDQGEAGILGWGEVTFKGFERVHGGQSVTVGQ